MSNLAIDLIREAREAGYELKAEGDKLLARPVADGARADVLPRLKAHKAELLAALAPPKHAAPVTPWWRDQVGVTARFDEIAGHLEFDEGLPRQKAEERAITLLVVEMRAHGLTRHEAEAMVWNGYLRRFFPKGTS